jgi:hypothetical protein
MHIEASTHTTYYAIELYHSQIHTVNLDIQNITRDTNLTLITDQDALSS